MNTLFMYFNHEGKPVRAALRVNGKKLKDATLWNIWDWYQILLGLGAHPVTMDTPDGGYVHMIQY